MRDYGKNILCKCFVYFISMIAGLLSSIDRAFWIRNPRVVGWIPGLGAEI